MGNFAILRVEKVKTMSSVAARGRHNFREQPTPNADAERLDLNVAEGAKNTDELCSAVFGLLPAKHRKDAVVCLEYLVTASPEHFGQDWQESKNYGQDYFKDAIAWLEAKHGKGSVVCKTIHLDESTPHLAAFVVPLVAGKLNAKAFTGGAKALADMQTDFAETVGIKHGLERGVERSQSVHQDNAKIKPMVAERLELRKQVKVLAAEVERLTKAVGGGSAALAAAQDALDKMQARYERSQKNTIQFMNDLNKVEAEKNALKVEVEGLKATLEAASAVIDHREAQKALLEGYKLLGEATPSQLKVGVVVAAVPGLAVLSLGRGVFVSHRLTGDALAAVGKELNEQQRGRVSR